ncbi:MAG: hypothetical protein V4613_06960 [Bacteroidota bacterium]
MTIVLPLFGLFFIALIIAYFYDYKKNKAIYKNKGQGKLYAFIIIAIILIVIGYFLFVTLGIKSLL